MTFDAHANFATSTVATAPSPATSGTSLVVTAGQGARFPAVPFNAVVCQTGVLADPTTAEVVRVTAISTDTLTITRAQESSTARTVVVGDRIYAAITNKTLTDIEVNTEFAFSAWKDVAEQIHGYGNLASAAASDTWIHYVSGSIRLNTASSGVGAFYIDPADYSGGSGRTTQVRVRGSLLTNSVAPAVNFTHGLYPITGFGSGSNLYPTITSVGAAICSVTRNTPAASSQFHDESAAVTFPAAGWYCLAVVLSGAAAANSQEHIVCRLQVRQV